MSNKGPYFIDQDGDAGIIGPGINADAPAGVELVRYLDDEVFSSVQALGGGAA